MLYLFVPKSLDAKVTSVEQYGVLNAIVSLTVHDRVLSAKVNLTVQDRVFNAPGPA